MSACSFAEEALWPSITNTRPIAERQERQVVVGQMATSIAVVPAPEDTDFVAPARAPLPDGLPEPSPEARLWADSLAAQQAALDDRNNRLQNLRATSRDALQSFQARAASINKRLLASTAPNDQVLQADWGRSRGDLDVVEEVVEQYQALSAESLAAASALSGLQTEIRKALDATAASASAANQGPRLTGLADDTAQTLTVVQDMSAALGQDNSALNAQIGLAKLDLEAMEAAIPGGAYVGNALALRAQGAAAPPRRDGAANLVGRRDPLAVINFADAGGAFEPALFTIVYAALSRRPNAGFDLVGVSPGQVADAEEDANSAVYTSRLDVGRTNAQRVRRALLSMGLPADRMSLDIASSPIADSEEVYIYVR
jgi:hypothetical protein